MPQTDKMSSITLIEDYGVNSSGCGYCSQEQDTSVTHGMVAHAISVEHYQALLDRGWRRSGRWLYKPVHACTCCQLITIRLDVYKFQPSKDQRKVTKRWQAYLEGAPLRAASNVTVANKATPSEFQQPPPMISTHREGINMEVTASDTVLIQGGSPKRSRTESETSFLPSSPEQRGGGKRFRGSHQSLEELLKEEKELARVEQSRLPRPISVSDQLTTIHINSSVKQPATAGSSQGPATPDSACSNVVNALTAALELLKVEVTVLQATNFPTPVVQVPTAKQKKVLKDTVVFTSPYPLTVSGLANQKIKSQNIDHAALNPVQVAEQLIKYMQDLPDGLTVEASKGHLNFHSTDPGSLQISTRVSKISKSLLAKAAAEQRVPRTVVRHFEIRMLPSSDPTLVEMEFALYQKYQIIHHGDDPSDATPRTFKRFLCDSPLRSAPASAYPPGQAPSCGFGSFHQQYFIDGRLVAVGVVDILPKCLSSKYLFWDPELGSLSLGKLSSLKEIEWVAQASQACSSLHYYYMGYYIHNCHRMRYKADFAPSDLLCPVEKCWVPFDRVKAAVETAGRPHLAAVPGALQGLDAEYCVAEGRSINYPYEPTDEEVGKVKLFLTVPGTGQRASKGQIATFEQLQSLGALSEAAGVRLKERIKTWLIDVGPVGQNMLFQL